MEALTSTEELTDAIAVIEMERQERAREEGNATACAEALRRLQVLQMQEKDALKEQGPSDIHSANLATLTAEIAKVQRLGGATNRSSQGGKPRHEGRGDGGRAPVREPQHPPSRNRGRRSGSRGGTN